MKTEYSFASANKVNQIHCVRWAPKGEPKAVIFLIHGMQEYIERYEEFADYLVRKGYVVAGHDHIGHGHTAEQIDKLGIMPGKNPKKCMVEDITTHYRHLRKKYKGIPMFLMGHSMGSYLLRCFLAEKANLCRDVSGVILSGTGSENPLLLAVGRQIIKINGLLHGWEYRSAFVKGLMFHSAYRGYNLDGTKPEDSWLTSDAKKAEIYYADPYCNFTFSLGGYRALADAARESGDLRGIRRIPKELKILFISGKEDPVGGRGKGTKKAYEKFVESGILGAELVLYEGLRHELLHEVCREEIYQEVADWIENNCP